ncbi:WD domain, G-beta repeat protein [Oesophagostomum dentatum]|uniref:WD domain, G-beta repeat protein n=1 Tax=Oesophagostomum dentatum TaxID=61180 RepID=A0A0B1TLJ7_OESDE|nr:WD domain, G-beta repeat protein [Oesophagostomum dentatum]
MQWFPRTNKREGTNDMFVLSSSDGRIHFINKMGKIEKSFEAHKGAALQAKWSPDGTGFFSCGEDGAVKLWSRNGMLRSVIAQMPSPVYCVSFDAASDNILFSNNEYCYIKSLKTQAPPLKWKAHESLVLCSDWSLVSEHIVTGGEDCKFKWPHSLEKLTSGGSLLSLCWFDDSTQLVAGSGSGQVIHAQIVGSNVTALGQLKCSRTVESGGLEVVQTKRNLLEVRDMNVDHAQETLETRDRITHSALAHNQLVVVTILQLYIYSSRNWNTPVIVDLKDKTVATILQSSK